jgi:hypothetical protein
VAETQCGYAVRMSHEAGMVAAPTAVAATVGEVGGVKLLDEPSFSSSSFAGGGLVTLTGARISCLRNCPMVMPTKRVLMPAVQVAVGSLLIMSA